MDSLYIVMPAYNEEDNICSVVEDWYGVLLDKSDDSRLVIADSGSTDKTHEMLLNLQKKYPKLEVLSNTGKYHGPKLIALYKYAISKGADFIFQTDSDGQTNPNEFMFFWYRRNEYDGIFGNRLVRGDGRSRAFVEKVVCILLKLFFKVNIPDANAPFRLMRTNIVGKYINRFENDYALPNIMIATFFVYYKERVLFENISFESRQHGKNSINILKIVQIGFKSLKDFWHFKKSM